MPRKQNNAEVIPAFLPIAIVLVGLPGDGAAQVVRSERVDSAQVAPFESCADHNGNRRK